MGEAGDRSGRTRSVAELLIGSLIVLLARGRRMPSAQRWRAGAVEIQLPFATGRYSLRHADGTLQHRSKGPVRTMRPLLLAGFLFAFAGIGVGFGGLEVAPPSAFAPGTPDPQQVSIVHIAADPTEPPAAANEQSPVLARVLPTATGVPVAIAELDPSPTATEEPPAATTTPTPLPPTPTATSVPVTQEPEPEPAYDYYPIHQLSEAEFLAIAAEAGWPATLHADLLAVARCESSLRPNAQTLWAYGIMQLVPSWFEFAGQEFTTWTDPVANLRAAYAVYLYDLERGSAPWYQWVCQPPRLSPAPAVSTTVPPTVTATVLAAATNASTEQ